MDEKAQTIEQTAAEILRHYERTNRAVGKERDAVIRLLRVREAMKAKGAGRPELALEVSEWSGGVFDTFLTSGGVVLDHGVHGPYSDGRGRRAHHAQGGGVQGPA